MTIYLDWNATTPPLAEVIERMADQARMGWGNPSSIHALGRLARQAVEDAREAVATLLSADPRDVIFTASATEANNLALSSACSRPERARIVLSRLEHPSVVATALAQQSSKGASLRWLALDEGRVDLADLERALGEADTTLVVLSAVNQETGALMDVDGAIALCKKARVPIHVDLAQAVGRTENLACGADSRSIAAHKFRGPKGVGALVLGEKATVSPLVHGGSQEQGRRAGTLDPVALAGLSVAARHAIHSPGRYAALGSIRDHIEQELCARGALPNYQGPRAPHVTSMHVPGWPGPELVAALDLEGVCVASGSACGAGKSEPSGTLVAMYGQQRGSESIRISLGETSSSLDAEGFLRAFDTLLGRTPIKPPENLLEVSSGV